MAEDGEQLVDENGDSIDKVREILFGAQQRKADQRFGILEKHIEREVRALDEKLEESKRGMDRRLSEMETKIVDEMKKLSQRLDDALTGFRKEADQTSAQLGERLSAAERSMRDDIEAQSRQTLARIGEMKSDLETTAASLDADKTSRDELGGYLMELGMRLTSGAGAAAAPKSGKSDGQPVKK